MNKVGIVCCSNGLSSDAKGDLAVLLRTLKQIGVTPVLSDCLFQTGTVFSANDRHRAEALMQFYLDDTIDAIFDVSGGDIANGILPYLDYETISQTGKQIWGYSDLTTVLNAVYARSGCSSVLYQARFLIGRDSAAQCAQFSSFVQSGTPDLFRFPYQFVQGNTLHGVVVGGNIRCLLKLAGTPYWPDMHNKILLLEARSGAVPQMAAYLAQLSQLGAFQKISGILLGTFSQMQRDRCVPDIITLVKHYAGSAIPIAKTEQIGHGANSKAIVIGSDIHLT